MRWQGGILKDSTAHGKVRDMLTLRTVYLVTYMGCGSTAKNSRTPDDRFTSGEERLGKLDSPASTIIHVL